MNSLFVINAFACWFMTGVIWLVQVLLYPLFKRVGEKEFKALHRFHMNSITWVVAPVMALELLTAILLYHQSRTTLHLGNLISVVGLWALTGLVNVPTHNKLEFASEVSKSRLVQRNWPRTLVWTGRSFMFVLIMIEVPNGGYL